MLFKEFSERVWMKRWETFRTQAPDFILILYSRSILEFLGWLQGSRVLKSDILSSPSQFNEFHLPDLSIVSTIVCFADVTASSEKYYNTETKSTMLTSNVIHAKCLCAIESFDVTILNWKTPF